MGLVILIILVVAFLLAMRFTELKCGGVKPPPTEEDLKNRPPSPPPYNRGIK